MEIFSSFAVKAMLGSTKLELWLHLSAVDILSWVGTTLDLGGARYVQNIWLFEIIAHSERKQSKKTLDVAAT
jgi:hypothetical protein